MGLLMDMTKAYLDSKGVHYTQHREDALRFGIAQKNREGCNVIAYLEEEKNTVCLRSYNLCKIPEEKKAAIYKLCSECNYQYRWVKFFVDETDNTITVQDDAIVEPESAGEEIMHLAFLMSDIIDEAYPKIMKTLYA